MMTEKELKKYCHVGINDLDCSLAQFEKEMNENINRMLKKTYWQKSPIEEIRNCAAGIVWREHSKRFNRKFSQGGGPDAIYNEDGTPYVPGRDDAVELKQ